jgi:hypothetical protein
MAKTPCAVCGRMGVAATCEKCHREVCAECATADPAHSGPASVTICNECRHRDSVEAVAEQAPVEIAAEAAGGYGFLESMSRAFTFLKESVVMAVADKDLMLPAIFSTLGSGVLLAIIVLILWGTGVLETLAKSDRDPWWWLAVAAPIMLLSLAVGYFFTGMTIHLVDAHLRGRDARLDEAFADARKNFLALVGLAVVSTLVGLVTGMLRGRRGRGLGDYAADAIDRVWVVATYLILPAIILEDLSLRAAANRARDLHQRNLVGIAVGEVGVVVLTRIISIIGVICAGVIVFAMFSVAGAVALIPGIVIGGVLLSLVIAFTTYVRAAYYTCLFLWAVATEKQGERAAAPAPLAVTLARAA